MAKRAIEVTAQTITAECPCGGSVMDSTNGSYQLTADSIDHLVCDTCEAEIRIGKTARLFS